MAFEIFNEKEYKKMKKSRLAYIVGICIAVVILVTAGLVAYTLFNGSKVTEDDKKEVEELLENILKTAYIEKNYEKADTLFYPELNEEDLLWEVRDIEDGISDGNRNNDIVDIEVKLNEAKEFKHIENHDYDHEKDAILKMQKVCDDGKFYVYNGKIDVKGTEKNFTVEMSYEYPPFILGKVEGKWVCINYHAMVDMYYNDLTLEDMNNEEFHDELYQYMINCITDYEMLDEELLSQNESIVVKWDSNGLVDTGNEKFNEVILSGGGKKFAVINKSTGKYPKVDIIKNENGMYQINVDWE
ncbi:MAG: hypothetical protein IJC76_06605 [Lachnospiraceae bacterium]|nr:hypothetical protein [Lachnospiraceae bacterium]